MATYHVKISGSDLSGDGSEGNPWRSINYGWSQLSGGAIGFDTGDELLVWFDSDTPYTEQPISPNYLGAHGITAYGVDSAGVRADDPGWNRSEKVRVDFIFAAGQVGWPHADNQHFRGFVLNGQSSASRAFNAVRVNGTISTGDAKRKIWLEDLEIFGFVDDGSWNADDGSIADRVEVHDCGGWGLRWGSENVAVRSTLTYRCDAGGVEATSGSLQHVTSHECGDDAFTAQIDGGSGGLLTNCNATDNPVGWGISGFGPSDCNASGNAAGQYQLGSGLEEPPGYLDAAADDYMPGPGSALIGAGVHVLDLDLDGVAFRDPPAIGALEYDAAALDPQLADSTSSLQWAADASGEQLEGIVPPFEPYAFDPENPRQTLRNAVLASWFSDARATEEEAEAAGVDDRRGWWADELIGDDFGSKIWLLTREALTDEVIGRFEDYGLEALEWLVEEGVATSVSAEAEIVEDPVSKQRIPTLTARIVRGSGDEVELRFEEEWKELWQR